MSSPYRPRWSARRVAALAFVVVCLLSPLRAGAQAMNAFRDCAGQLVRSDLTTRLVSPSSLDTVMQFRRNFVVSCPAERKRLAADSADFSKGVLHMMGRVRYTENGVEIQSREMFYHRVDDRIDARGDVVARLESGTTMRGPNVLYWARNLPLQRTQDLMQATGRPHFLLVENDSATGVTDSTTVDAGVVFMNGDDIYASDSVVIDRSDMTATGDSIYVFQGRENRLMRIMRGPVVKGKGERAFTMTGFLIEAFASGRTISRVVSKVGASVVSPRLDLAADTIELGLVDEELNLAVAWGRDSTRATAKATSGDKAYDMIADSLFILMPGQIPAEVRAYGTARIDMTPHASIITDEKDRIKGDTIIAVFRQVTTQRLRLPPDSAARGDSTGGVVDSTLSVVQPMLVTDTSSVLSSLTSNGSASIFFHEASKVAQQSCPTIAYAAGISIAVAMNDSGEQIRTVTVDGGGNPVSAIRSECGTQGSGTGRGGGPGGNVTSAARIPPA